MYIIYIYNVYNIIDKNVTYTNELNNTKDRQTTSESSMIWSLKTWHKVLES